MTLLISDNSNDAFFFFLINKKIYIEENYLMQ